jgi:hypothetical protein
LLIGTGRQTFAGRAVVCRLREEILLFQRPT